MFWEFYFAPLILTKGIKVLEILVLKLVLTGGFATRGIDVGWERWVEIEAEKLF